MLKKRILARALIIVMGIAGSTTSVFAVCETDPSYEWVRLSHRVHHDMLNEIATGGHVAASDPKGLFNAEAITSAFVGKETVSHQNELFNIYEENYNMFKTVGESYVDGAHLIDAGTAYINSVHTYWNQEKLDSFYNGTTKYSEDGMTSLAEIMGRYTLIIQNDKVAEQIIADQKVKELAKQFKQQSSDPFELAKLVHDYLKDRISYDTVPKGSKNSSDYNTVYGAIVLGTADCTGYALAFNQIMNELGIPTMNVTGHNHLWNRTRINGVWYHTDVTFSDSDTKDWLMLTESEFKSRPFNAGEYAHTETHFSKVIGDIAYSVEFRNDQDYEANVLKSAGLFSGDANGFRLSDSITRAEMAALLVKVVGATDEVVNNSASFASKCKFTDVPNWAKPSVGYCVEKGLINGIGNGLYGSSNVANKLDFSTVLLRALGKSEVQYNTSDAMAVDLGYLEYGRAAFADLNRADVVNTVYNAYKSGAIK